MSGAKARAKAECHLHFGEADRDLLYTHVVEEAREHALRLCGRLPYSLQQVKPAVSARIIWRLLVAMREIIDSRGARARRRLEQENRELRLAAGRMRHLLESVSHAMTHAEVKDTQDALAIVDAALAGAKGDPSADPPA